MGEMELTEGDSKEKVNLKLSPKVGGQRKKVYYTILLGSGNPPLPCRGARYTGFFDSTRQNKSKLTGFSPQVRQAVVGMNNHAGEVERRI